MESCVSDVVAPVKRPVARGLCIVMVCTDHGEAEQVARLLSEVNSGCMVTYRRAEDLVHNAPTGRVALVVLANNSVAPALGRTLRWLRHRWPRCPVAVVGDTGCGDHEMAAREGGAFFLTRPVAPEEWSSLLDHVLEAPRQEVASRELS
jgi:FixJ family two-component response regulator